MTTLAEVEVWRTIELPLVASDRHDDPYRNIEVHADFVGPDGTVIRRPAFWNGGSSWVIRFAPTQQGTWTFRTDANVPSDTGLHGVEGALTCTPARSDEVVYRHGFLRVPSGARHLTHADGTPFFWLGDTHWRFATERWDAANKDGWSSQFRDTVDLRVKQGFTVYQSNILSYDDRWAQGGAWTDEKRTRINVDYFRDVLDPRMAYVADAGLVNAVGLSWYETASYGADSLARFARYIVARYGSYPVAWTLAGEVPGYHPRLRDSQIETWNTVARAIQQTDGYRHPRTAHSTNERPLPDYFANEAWFDFGLSQLGHGDMDLSTSHYEDYLSRHPGKPLVEGESMYEGLMSVEPAGRRTVTDTMVRQVAYRAIQSGCCGYSYGAQGCWNGAWELGDGDTSWGDLGWYEGVDLPGATQLSHLKGFYTSLEWWTLSPTPDAFSTEDVFNAVFSPSVVAADPDRTTIIVYFGETYRIGGGPAAFIGLPDEDFDVSWFNPRSGVSTTVLRGVRPESGALSLPDKPDQNDWLLWARRTASLDRN